ncbi:MAG: hypothetical protein JWP14_2040 [Frankiales bacterium]|nr:hypothetical protein [Frankiales bacterium]
MLSELTAGLVGDRDPAQPLLTYVDGPARIELSGATAANWVCKTANLLVDGYGGPDRVGIMLPLHWQTPCLLLGAVATGAAAVVTSDPRHLAGCAVAFTTADGAEAALDAGVEEVFACSLTPFASRLAQVPAHALDAAVELPGYGDHFGGRPRHARVEVDGRLLDVPALDVGPSDRVLTTRDPRSAEGLTVLLGALRAGAAVVLLREGDADEVGRQEGVTRSLV